MHTLGISSPDYGFVLLPNLNESIAGVTIFEKVEKRFGSKTSLRTTLALGFAGSVAILVFSLLEVNLLFALVLAMSI